MKNTIDSNFTIAILLLVSACLAFAFWFLLVQDELANTSTVASPQPSIDVIEKNDEVTIDIDSLQNVEMKKTEIQPLNLRLSYPEIFSIVQDENPYRISYQISKHQKKVVALHFLVSIYTTKRL